jgi:hypothetical protein
MTNKKFTDYSVTGNQPETSANPVIRPEESYLTDADSPISSMNCCKMASPSINPPARHKEANEDPQEPESKAKLKNLEEKVKEMHNKVAQTLDKISPEKECKNLFTWSNLGIIKNSNMDTEDDNIKTQNSQIYKRAKRGRPKKELNNLNEIEDKNLEIKKQKKLDDDNDTSCTSQSLETRILKLERAVEQIYTMLEGISHKLSNKATAFEQKFGKIPSIHMDNNKKTPELLNAREEPKVLRKLNKEASIRILNGEKAYEPTKFKLIKLQGIQKCKISNLKQALKNILEINFRDLGLISYSIHSNAWLILIREKEIDKLGKKDTVNLKISQVAREDIKEDQSYLKALKSYLEDKSIHNLPAQIASKIILNNLESLNDEKLCQVLNFEQQNITPKPECEAVSILQALPEESLGVQL